MSARLPNSASSIRNPDRDNAFRVLIVYEDYPSGRCAMDTYQRLLSRFGREFDFRISIWSFGVLQCSRLNEDAVQDAVDADAIILAAHFRDELPAEIKRWIDGWVPQKRGQTAAFIALLGQSAGQPDRSSRAQDYLREAAATAGIDFLTQGIQFDRNERAPAPPFNEPGSRRSSEGWGLNE